MLRRIPGLLFLCFIVLACWQCARRGNPTGGPKDLTPPELLKAEPPNMTINFKAKKIRLYFDEYIKINDVQNQLIISPPLKYLPQITPQGSARKYVEIVIKDTLAENTTYTFNFGQSIVDNNEGNPNSFLTYVFSTGDYIDSLEVSGVVKDAFNREADEFISVMLYEIDSAYTDSTIYKRPPNYITNTLDSTTIFTLKNLKAGKYAMFGLTDVAKNNTFDQRTDKIAFLKDTITLPTDSIYLLNLFREIPDYSASIPSFASKNRIIFGYQGKETPTITPITKLPDTVRTMVTKEREKDTLNYWFTPFETDSIVFKVSQANLDVVDTFSVKVRKLALDSLVLTPNQRGSLDFEKLFSIRSNTPIVKVDTTQMRILNKDSVAIAFTSSLDTIKNKVDFEFELEPNANYYMDILPGAITDFYNATNDTLNYRLSTASLADFGSLRFSLTGAVTYPLIMQLTEESGDVIREIYATEPTQFEFNYLEPANYFARVIFDTNGNKKWDTGNYLKKIQPEKISYYPGSIEMRANWEKIETFTILE